MFLPIYDVVNFVYTFSAILPYKTAQFFLQNMHF